MISSIKPQKRSCSGQGREGAPVSPLCLMYKPGRPTVLSHNPELPAVTPRIRHDREGAKPTLPPLQSFWMTISWSLSAEPEAQEHDSQLKQQFRQPKCQQSCPVLTLPLRATVTLSGEKQFLHFLCPDPHRISNRQNKVGACGPHF